MSADNYLTVEREGDKPISIRQLIDGIILACDNITGEDGATDQIIQLIKDEVIGELPKEKPEFITGWDYELLGAAANDAVETAFSMGIDWGYYNKVATQRARLEAKE